MTFAAWCKKELGNPHSLSYSTVPGAHVADVVTSGLFHVVFTKCDIFWMFLSIMCFYGPSLLRAINSNVLSARGLSTVDSTALLSADYHCPQ